MHFLPSFSTLNTDTFPNTLAEFLAKNLKKIDDLTKSTNTPTWASLMHPLACLSDELERLFSPLSHLHAVVNTQPLRACYETCLPQLSAYETTLGHHQGLYNAMQALDRGALTSTQCKILDDHLLSFRLSGVALERAEKERFQVISARLSDLENQFENNVLDATHAFEYHLEDSKTWDGLPEHAIASARELAEKKGVPGLILTLEYPCYIAVMTYVHDRSVREKMYQAYVTRASDQGPCAGRFDNSPVMQEILSLRDEMAHLLGFPHYSALSLASKMAESPAHVHAFLNDLRIRAYPQAKKEYAELQVYARNTHALLDLAPWDIAYFSEKQRYACYDLSQEELRPYFPVTRVLDGLFHILKILYGMRCEMVTGVDTWHDDVTCCRLMDEENTCRGYIYLDLFSRAHKRGGAWMNTCQSRMQREDGSWQLPVATLTCNFARAAHPRPATLSHDEVLTLFHEFGHCLQHVLTTVDDFDAAGLHGVEWDAVELPSQFFENWCFDQEALNFLTAHVDTHEPLPVARYQQLMAARHFQSAMSMMRQLEFSLFDFRIHEEYVPQDPAFVSRILADVRATTSVVPLVAYNRFAHGFSHIFAGGYAAGYYSYKWAEVLSSDAFARFEEEGVLNPQTGRDFLHKILEVGGSCKALDAFVSFRGRKPAVDALLRHCGVGEASV